MPGPIRQLTLQEARDHIERRCFDSSDQQSPDLVGLETEWLVVRRDDPTAPVSFSQLCAGVSAGGRPPSGSSVTYEPGGQLELSGPPAPNVGAACEAMAADVAFAQRLVDRQGLRLVGEGHDPWRPARRVVDSARYRAMESFFAADGGDGSRMMSSTAALQVNVGLGGPSTAHARWERAQALGPALVAAFANSPLADGRRTGWKSMRFARWCAIDPSRTAPVAVHSGPPAWADYALAARVMFIRSTEVDFQPLREPLPFAAWVQDGHELGHPTVDDLDYHLTTLFPPVRPRGWLEIRYLDALPDPWWRVAAAVVATLVIDEEAGTVARGAVEGTEDLWAEAARYGLAHRALARAAADCFVAALDGGRRAGVDPASLKRTAEYFERYVEQGRCPADERVRKVA